jgi:2-polyprenyl-3-methyl-5-hydroxy-6-metoxy-1,4-benzoquinol methylase
MPGEDPNAATRFLWDGAAATFDDEPDHGLRNEITREAWSQLLQRLLPSPPVAVLDAGCGTGSLSTLLGSLGYRVTGIDVSPAMLAIAREKVRNAALQVGFLMQNAAAPMIPGREFSVVLCRHVLWTIPNPRAVLRRWSELLRPGGRMVLIEGFWHTGAGLRP